MPRPDETKNVFSKCDLMLQFLLAFCQVWSPVWSLLFQDNRLKIVPSLSQKTNTLPVFALLFLKPWFDWKCSFKHMTQSWFKHLLGIVYCHLVAFSDVIVTGFGHPKRAEKTLFETRIYYEIYIWLNKKKKLETCKN